MKTFLTLLFIVSLQNHGALGKQKDFEGVYTIYTKHQDCEILKTKAVFTKDHSFQLFSTCGDVVYSKHGYNSLQGNWRKVNDNLVKVTFVKKHYIEFKILSDTLIELQGTAKFNKPKYKKEQR